MVVKLEPRISRPGLAIFPRQTITAASKVSVLLSYHLPPHRPLFPSPQHTCTLKPLLKSCLQLSLLNMSILWRRRERRKKRRREKREEEAGIFPHNDPSRWRHLWFSLMWSGSITAGGLCLCAVSLRSVSEVFLSCHATHCVLFTCKNTL